MAQPGTVYLVGAGPGDPGLLTLRGLECLRRADLVLYDGLANPLLLAHTAAHAERTARAADPAGRTLHQREINRRLIAAARAGKTVVRLKGGDPFIFGRGSEEAAALAEAGIPFEVVPGVTAAIAAGEYAGIALTHRELSSAVAFVTGHEDQGKAAPAVDYAQLARFKGTLVFYMGLHRLEHVVGSLLDEGKPPDVPACVISRATTPLQRTVSAPLGELVAAVRAAELRPPSLIVVGEVVRQRERIAWFEQRPLFGMRIGITRAETQAAETIARCLELGAQPVPLPTIEINPPDDPAAVDAALDRINSFDWIVFTSANGVAGLLGRLWERGEDARRLAAARIAAIGPATAEALERFRLRADLVPKSFRSESLAESLASHVAGKRVLWARANRGRDVLPRALDAAGAILEQVTVYRSDDVAEFPAAARRALEEGEVDWIGLSSPSIARALARLLPEMARARLGKSLRLASISPVTTAAAHDAGLPIAAEAREFTWEGIFAAIEAESK
ncbi:MAG: uroporphyrinogen-III C-methyltransferase [Planctomycetaceae bacterium]